MDDVDELLQEQALSEAAASPPREAEAARRPEEPDMVRIATHACSHACRARDPLGSPKVTRGRVPKVPYCCTTESFWSPFWYPFLGTTCTQFYKKLQNGAPKSCQNRPSGAGAWGAWVLAVFIGSLQDQPPIKNNNHPSSPSTRPGGPVLTTFGGLILLNSVELYAKVEKRSLPKWPPKWSRCATV